MTDTSELWRKFLSKNYDRLLKETIQRRFPDEPEKAESIISYVSEKIAEDNMRRLRNYDPKQGAKPETYFKILVRRLTNRSFEEGREHFRLPRGLTKQNDFLLALIYKHLCWEKMPETDVVEYIRQSSHGGRSASVIREGVQIIRDSYPDCGKKREEDVAIDEDKMPSSERTSQAEAIFQEWRKICQAILNGPDNDPNSGSDWGKINIIREKLRRKFRPKPEQRLFLRMTCQDGMSVKDAAEKLGWTLNQAYGHKRRLLKKLRLLIIADDLKETVNMPF